MTVDFSAIPSALADALTISEFSAEILVSAFVVLLFVICTAIFTQEMIVLVIMAFLGITVSIALGWLDYFFLIFAALIVALLYSAKISALLSGG
ncbi:MAG TPA: hypothetical protein VKA34_03190 [Balneolales bacterium]|nr:hypothetical protein [Balneolales bacterium]